MNWFRQNRFLGRFLIVFGIATMASAVFLWQAKSRRDEAQARFSESATELIRLQRLSPFPNEANLQKMKTQAQEYAAELSKVKEELKTRMLPAPAIAPNEFQTRLNQLRTVFSEKARANKVKLPENFFLGFEDFAAALPDTAAAPLLAQELAQVETMLNIIIEARVDAITSLRRVPLAERSSPVSTPPPIGGRPTPMPAAKGPPLIERNVIDLSSPGRRVPAPGPEPARDRRATILYRAHTARLNEKEKGPPRESARPEHATSDRHAGANTALNFIVGNEHIQADARIEMLRFTY